MSAPSLIDPSPDAGAQPAVERLKAGSVGLTGVMFMALATAAPITAMTGNLPIIIGSGIRTVCELLLQFRCGKLPIATVGSFSLRE